MQLQHSHFLVVERVTCADKGLVEKWKCGQLLVKQFSLKGPRSELCCESPSFCCSFGGEVFVGNILAIHHFGSALTVNVLKPRIDNLSETNS